MVTLDPRTRSPSRQPYQGIVPFEGDSVAQVLEHYMGRSEQVPTRLWLAADASRATGLLLQRLPEEGGRAAPVDADGWNRLCRLADTLQAPELLALPASQVLHRLFWQEPLHGFDQRACHFACSCSRDKVASMLRMLGEAEVVSIITERGAVEVRCEFCNLAYGFDAVDCAALFTGEEPHSAPGQPQ